MNIDDYYYDEDRSDHDYIENDGFDDIGIDNIKDEEKLLFQNMNDIAKITEDSNKIKRGIHQVKISKFAT